MSDLDPRFWLTLSGIATFAALYSWGYLLLVQTVLWPRDRQMRAAHFLVFMTVAILVQLTLAYLGVFSFGNTPRGFISYALWCLGAVMMAVTTRGIVSDRMKIVHRWYILLALTSVLAIVIWKAMH
jgi:hypothetical membrane protein